MSSHGDCKTLCSFSFFNFDLFRTKRRDEKTIAGTLELMSAMINNGFFQYVINMICSSWKESKTQMHNFERRDSKQYLCPMRKNKRTLECLGVCIKQGNIQLVFEKQIVKHIVHIRGKYMSSNRRETIFRILNPSSILLIFVLHETESQCIQHLGGLYINILLLISF